RRHHRVSAPRSGSDRTPAVSTRSRARARLGRAGSPSGQRQCAPVPGLRLLQHRRRSGHAGGDLVMSVIGGVAAAGLQVLAVGAGAPLLIGVMRQVRARLEGRVGAGVGQPWRDLRKLMRKEPLSPRGTSEVFRIAPLILVATTLIVAAVVPLVTTASPLDSVADLFAVVALLTLGAVALALAGIDTGTAFGGMGASREMTIVALVEPTLLLA